MNTATTPFPAAADTAPAGAAAPSRRLRRILLSLLAGAVAVAGTVQGTSRARFAYLHETTDNAQVEGHVSPVLPRVGGYVSRVLVTDNQRVAAGQPLLEIDPAELDLRIAGADSAWRSACAAVTTAEAALTAARAAAAVAQANAGVAEVAQAKTAADLARDENLFRAGVVTDQQLADTRAAAAAATAQWAAAQRGAEAAGAQVAVAAAGLASTQTQVAGRAAELDYARLQRQYATVTAPIAGLVSRKNVEAGQFVPAGQTLLSIAADRDLWIVANFKETQLERMHDGQTVEFTVDGQPGHTFRGRVESLSGATGARFALLPPDNATGNFVKVTQRVPVKIVPEAEAVAGFLRPGMSIVASVQVRN